MKYELTIPGKPVEKKRARTPKGGGRPYDIQKEAKAAFQRIAREQLWGIDPLTGPLCVEMTFFFERPRSHYRTGNNSALLKHDAPKWHFVKPDRDNLEKFASDCLNGILWKDDCQICEGSSKKLYVAAYGLARTEISVERGRDARG